MKNLTIVLLLSFHFTTFAQQWCIPPNGPNEVIWSILNYKNKLVISGYFNDCGGVATKGLVTWDGVNWDNIVNDNIIDKHRLSMVDNLLYILPTTANNEMRIKTWDGITLNTLSNNIFEKDVLAIAKYKGELYVGGRFNRVVRPSPYGGSTYDIARRIAKKQPIKYLEVGNGLLGLLGTGAEVLDMTIYKGELYLAGYFLRDNANTMKMEDIGRWNGTRWDSVGTGFVHLSYDLPTSLEVDTINDFLYVGGTFSKAGGIPSNCVARWDGHHWESLNNPMLWWHFANKLKFYHKELYVGYSSPGDGTSCADTLVAKWDGQNWYFINGINSVVFDMEIFRDTLYIAGGMSKLYDTIPLPYFIGYYAPPPTHCNWLISRIYAINDTITLGDTIHFENNNKYATSWQWDFGDGVTDSVQKPNHVYQNSGIYTASVIVHQENCYDTAYFTVNVQQVDAINTTIQKEYLLGNNIPNPFTNSTIIPYQIPQGKQGVIIITDTNGKEITRYALKESKGNLEVSTKGWQAGVYNYSLVVNGKKVESKQMVISN